MSGRSFSAGALIATVVFGVLFLSTHTEWHAQAGAPSQDDQAFDGVAWIPIPDEADKIIALCDKSDQYQIEKLNVTADEIAGMPIRKIRHSSTFAACEDAESHSLARLKAAQDVKDKSLSDQILGLSKSMNSTR